MKGALIFIIVSLSLLIGCDREEPVPKESVAIKLIVQMQVGKYLAEDVSRCPKLDNTVNAIRLQVTNNPDIKAVDSVNVLRKQIKWDSLTPEQSGLMSGLLLNIESKIRVDVANGQLEEAALLPLYRFLDWMTQTVHLACPNGIVHVEAVQLPASTSSEFPQSSVSSSSVAPRP